MISDIQCNLLQGGINTWNFDTIRVYEPGLRSDEVDRATKILTSGLLFENEK